MIIDLDLRNKTVILVGGGTECYKKLLSLITQQCKIIIISNKINKQILKLIQPNKITYKKLNIKNNINNLFAYNPFLIMALTDDKELNKKITEKANKRCYSYAVDDTKISDFSHPAIINIGDVIQIAISTGGLSPAMAKKIKATTKKIFKNIINYEDINKIKLQKIVREQSKKIFNSHVERKKIVYNILNNKNITKLLKEKKYKKAKKLTLDILRKLK